MRTRIELGSSGSIDLMDDVPYSLNFAVADIRTPDKRDASYSKTIRIPGSKQNDQLFAHIFEIDIDCNFNPNIKTPCILYIDEIQQLKGFLQLLKIYETNEYKREYEVTIKGQVGNVFTTIGDDELTALDLSEYDHGYNKTVQRASWSAPTGVGFVYPMIDYGQTNGLTYDVNNFFPAVYLKTYIDKIFEYANYTYSSAFFTSDFFKRLIIPYNGFTLKLTEVEAAERLFSVGLTSTQTVVLTSTYTVPTTTPVIWDDESAGNGFFDNGNQYNPATGIFTCNNTGVYSFTASSFINTTAGIAEGLIELYRYSAGVYTTYGTDAVLFTTTQTSFIIQQPNMPLLAGDQVFVGIQVRRVSGAVGNMEILGGGMYNGIVNVGVQDGGQISMANVIPIKIKMKDLLKSVINMFNLYIDVDKDNETQLNIEPRNDFYANGTTIDWTDKWDTSRELIQEPMGALDAKRYIYTYADDKDYYNTLYKNEFGEAYGTQIFDVTNDFLTQTKETKLIFAPTPLADVTWTDRIISSMIPDSLTTTELKGNVIRILYYGGLKDTSYPWDYTSTVAGTSSESQFPYAGHLDDVTTPTLDLSFAVPKRVYYLVSTYTNNHLFNKYHLQFLEEITDKDSKIITGYFYLTPRDILSLDFRNQFYVDGHLLRLNKIYDYNPVQQQLTKCEFIKIKQALQFVAETKTSSGGGNVTFPPR